MVEATVDTLRYPIGPLQLPEVINQYQLDTWINTIETFPVDLARLVSALTDQQLNTPYRSGGWTIRQLTHHMADSHLNGYIRFKWALTEERPMIKSYAEDLWAALPDSKADIWPSLCMVESLHHKWVTLLRGLDYAQLSRTFLHPDTGQEWTLRRSVGLYNWHCRHHLAHIQGVLDREGW